MDWVLVAALILGIVCLAVAIGFGPTAVRAACSLHWYHRGLRHYQNREPDQAEAMWRRAAGVSRLNVSARLALGKLLVERGDAEGALEQYRAALAARPTYAKARMNMANVLLAQKRFDEAVEQYEQAADGGIHTAHKLLGMLYEHHLNNPERALDHYQQYLVYKGADPEVVGAVARLSRPRDGDVRD